MGAIRKALASLVQDRKEMGHVNQKKIAEKMGCSESQVSSLLSGERRLNEDWILKFCQALSITPPELFARLGGAGGGGDGSGHDLIHRRLQHLLDEGIEDLVRIQLRLLEAHVEFQRRRQSRFR